MIQCTIDCQQQLIINMHILITGAKGQLGRALQTVLGQAETFSIDLPEHDILDRDKLNETVLAFRPEVIIHSAAFTNVDGCARDPDMAYRVNALGARNVALACQLAGCAMVYVSTNEVFDGRKTEPYLEFDQPHPINVYAHSKWAGEQFTRELLNKFYIVRTAWLYGLGGNNFVTKMVQLADTQGRLRVVADEFGSPTYATDLAAALVRLIHSRVYGVYHFVNTGIASRYDFACKIMELTGRAHVPVEPIASPEFQRASTPPLYTPLRNYAGAELGISLRPWQDALADYIQSQIANRK
jgi:dTDP-4-dehydrorhamnose reductase